MKEEKRLDEWKDEVSSEKWPDESLKVLPWRWVGGVACDGPVMNGGMGRMKLMDEGNNQTVLINEWISRMDK